MLAVARGQQGSHSSSNSTLAVGTKIHENLCGLHLVNRAALQIATLSTLLRFSDAFSQKIQQLGPAGHQQHNQHSTALQQQIFVQCD